VIDYPPARHLDTYSKSSFKKKNTLPKTNLLKTIIPQVNKIKDTNTKLLIISNPQLAELPCSSPKPSAIAFTT
jgi:hypothetical protein